MKTKAAPHGRPNNADIDSDFFKKSIDLRQHIQESFGNLLEEQKINFSNQKRANISGSTNLKMLLAGLIFLSLLRTSEAAPQNRSCNADIDSINFFDFFDVHTDSKKIVKASFGTLGLPPTCLHEFPEKSLKNLETRLRDEIKQRVFDCVKAKNLTTSEKNFMAFAKRKTFSYLTLQPNLQFDPVDRKFGTYLGKTLLNFDDYQALEKRFPFGISAVCNQNFTTFYMRSANTSFFLQRTAGNELHQIEELGSRLMRGYCLAEDADTSFVPDVPSWYEFLNSDVAKITGIGIAGVAVGAVATVLVTEACKKKAPESKKLSCKFKNGVSPKATVSLISDPTPTSMPKIWSYAVGGGQTRFSHLIENPSSESSEHDPDYPAAKSSGSSDHDPHYLEMKSATKTAYPNYEEVKPKEVTRKLYDTLKSPAVPVRNEYANVKLEENFLTGQTSAVTAN
ncbi:MAG: hypothetical protein ACRCYP_07260 [Alphaproteobacteria bacterium]